MNERINEVRHGQSRSSTPTLKVVVVGDSAVGKTSLIQQFVCRQFTGEYKATIGSDFLQKMVTLDSEDGTTPQLVWLNLWDTAGQERFRSISSTYYRGCDCAIVLFDVCREETFEKVGYWIDDVKANAEVDSSDDVPIIVVGNKIDEPAVHRVVQSKRALEVCKAHRATYAETSAKMGTNVDTVFRMSARMAVSRQSSVPPVFPAFVGPLRRANANGSGTECPC